MLKIRMYQMVTVKKSDVRTSDSCSDVGNLDFLPLRCTLNRKFVIAILNILIMQFTVLRK